MGARFFYGKKLIQVEYVQRDGIAQRELPAQIETLLGNLVPVEDFIVKMRSQASFAYGAGEAGFCSEGIAGIELLSGILCPHIPFPEIEGSAALSLV